ncbi:MAG: hypothetical protein J4432_03595 [DPANN group archaeon]|nr:hypothetical protein [DPANN group archaeon]
MELVSLKSMPLEAKVGLLKELGYNSDKRFVLGQDGSRTKDPYTETEVELSNMLILPGSTLILDNNPLSIAAYLEEYPDAL